jgi:hypothetical protein
MTYFLDFDRTLFDTYAFKKKFGMFLSLEEPYLQHLDLKGYVYPDVPSFLATYSKSSTIVTFGVRMFLIAKVTDALSTFPTERVVYATRGKGHVIRKLTANKKGPFIFVDDMHFQLESVSKMCPEVKVYEIRRDGREGNGRWPVIRSLEELPVA